MPVVNQYTTLLDKPDEGEMTTNNFGPKFHWQDLRRPQVAVKYNRLSSTVCPQSDTICCARSRLIELNGGHHLGTRHCAADNDDAVVYSRHPPVNDPRLVGSSSSTAGCISIDQLNTEKAGI